LALIIATNNMSVDCRVIYTLSNPAANRWPVPNGTHLGDQS